MREITAKEALATSKAGSVMNDIMNNIQKACSEGRTEIRITDVYLLIPQNDISKLRDLGYDVIEDITGKFNAVVISWAEA